MANEKDLKKGDRVEWNSHGGKTRSKGKATGTVVKKLTSETTIKGHQAKASKDDPQFLVESERSGGRAAHKPSALRKKKGSS